MNEFKIAFIISGARRTRWCHLSTVPGTTPHCLIRTEWNVNFLGTRSLVYFHAVPGWETVSVLEGTVVCGQVDHRVI